jgi:hypothetical protein
MLGTVKIDKLCFGTTKINPDLISKVDEVISKYYETFAISKKAKNQLYRAVTPTKQLRQNYSGFNHNLQMIPLEQFLQFLEELNNVAEQDLKVYEIHLAMDILVEEDTSHYLETIKSHKYMNGYVASSEEANTSSTVYISRKKKLDSKGKSKLRIKFYDKAKELISRNPENRVLPLKEPILDENIPMACAKGSNTEGVLLYKMNLLRCEIELRENKLPYTTIGHIIEAIKCGTFQNTIEDKFVKIMNNTVFADPNNVSSNTIKGIAATLEHNSGRNYKILFRNAGMSREYNYFKKAKEVITRENDIKFEELRSNLTNNANAATRAG